MTLMKEVLQLIAFVALTRRILEYDTPLKLLKNKDEGFLNFIREYSRRSDNASNLTNMSSLYQPLKAIRVIQE